MARKKKTTRKKKGGFFSRFSSKKKTRRSSKRSSVSAGLKIALTILFLSLLAAGGAVGLMYMEQFSKTPASESMLPVTFYAKGENAEWLQQEWYDQIYEVIGGRQFTPGVNLADEMLSKLAEIPWLYDTKVKVTPEAIEIVSKYRRPVGLVQVNRNKKVYLDEQMYVLDYLPVSGLPVIEIKGLNSTKVPPAGSQWFVDDAKAAVELLNWLYQMDLNFQQQREEQANSTDDVPQKQIPNKPLLDEIESIDVSNFDSRSKPNIVLNAKGGVKIYWGAAWGQATVYLEEDEKTKMNRLYGHFMDHDNTFQGSAKYIELRWLEGGIPRPR